jgi:hypothetical protein
MSRHRLAPRNAVPRATTRARIRHAGNARPGGFAAACQQKAARNRTGKVCDDPAGEVSNHLTARGSEIDAA